MHHLQTNLASMTFMRNLLSRALHYIAPSKLKLAIPSALHNLVPATPNKINLDLIWDEEAQTSSDFSNLSKAIESDDANAVGKLIP